VIDAMNTALMQLFGRNGSFKKVVIFSDSIAAINTQNKYVHFSSWHLKAMHPSCGTAVPIKYQTPTYMVMILSDLVLNSKGQCITHQEA
jgi:hypothetical protein